MNVADTGDGGDVLVSRRRETGEAAAHTELHEQERQGRNSRKRKDGERYAISGSKGGNRLIIGRYWITCNQITERVDTNTRMEKASHR